MKKKQKKPKKKSKAGHLLTIYDTTLRDGAQAEDISFSVDDKLTLLKALDDFGVHFIEGGWPGSNPRDFRFFREAKKVPLKHAKLVAFGSTHHARNAPRDDSNLNALIGSQVKYVTIFGKTWDLHVQEALRIPLKKNLQIITDSIDYLKTHRMKVIYDAEHFFDGFIGNPDYAYKTLEAAQKAEPEMIVFCDTNGGTLPDELEKILEQVIPELSVPWGIHCHNDSGVGVANSLLAARMGAAQIQGTINGFGERCGNADLTQIMANLQVKMGTKITTIQKMQGLKHLSRLVNEVANINNNPKQPFIGRSAFAHKGGIHVSAVARNPACYEHIEPEMVGNEQRILVSDLSGKENINMKAREWNIPLTDDEQSRAFLDQLKHLENEGYQFEAANGTLEILMRKYLDKHPSFFRLREFNVTDELKPGRDVEAALSKASLQIEVDGKLERTTAEGHGPVDALNRALRQSLERFYPELKSVQLVDYKVRVLPNNRGTEAKVRVLIDSTDGEKRWGTVGVHENIILASWKALVDSLEYKIIKSN